MALDFEKEAARTGLRFDVLRRWPGEHEVALVRMRREDMPEQEPSLYLYCECESSSDEDDADRPDPHSCAVKATIRTACADEARDANLSVWKTMGAAKAVLDIFARVQGGEYLGQHMAHCIYVQEVAGLLELPAAEVLAACERLFAEEKLDLNGMILAEHEPRFRFPKELQAIMRYMVEEPLGWPNGEAGDGLVATLEQAIHEHTDLKHGKDAFWEHNYPRIAVHHLLSFGLGWIDRALERAGNDEDALADLAWTDLDRAAKILETLAARLRAVSEDAAPAKAALRDVPASLTRIAAALERLADKGPVHPDRLQKVDRLLDTRTWGIRSLDRQIPALTGIADRLAEAHSVLGTTGRSGRVSRRSLRTAAKGARAAAAELKALLSRSS